MDWAQLVGRNVRRFRRERSWSQEALAQEASVAMRYVSGIERGEENPSLSVLVKIADALGVHPRDLLSDADG